MGNIRIYTDLDKFLMDYDPTLINDSFTRQQIGFNLERDDNLILLDRYNHCSYGSTCKETCGYFSECSVLYKQFIREKKLKRINK
jgi:hypothetical protein